MKNELIKGAFILSLGAFLSKLLGAVYRIPLTNLLGSYGIGLYQMVFPLYTLLLDFSGAGAPNAISRVISSYSGENKDLYAYNILQTSKRIFSVLGICFSLIMLCFSYLFSYAQGNVDSTLAYIFLSPSVLLVCIMSSYRGYFQGLMKMSPTALSQVVEQVVKLSFGLLFAYIFRENIVLAVAGATFAITISEFISLLFLVVTFNKNKIKNGLVLFFEKNNFRFFGREIIKNVIPITLIGVVIPFSQVADSFIIVNILKSYTEKATSLYGILTGVVNTVINLPVSVCYSIATVVIPLLSKEKGNRGKKKKSRSALFLTSVIGLLFAVTVFIFPETIINILFRRLSVDEKNVAINLLKITSINVLFISFMQTSNAVLIGNGKLYYPLFSMGVGVIIKIILNVILINNQKINIYGGAIALITCFFICDLINLILILSIKDNYANQTD